MTDFIFVLSRRYLETPGFLDFLSRGFGAIINLLFMLVQSLPGALAISIILMTILFRFAMLPLSIKSQKSMMKMRELKPELDKIKAKYGNTKDPELMRKSQQEQQALLSKHGANPLSGCLPMLIQMPLFIGLNTVMRQAAVYIRSFGDMYRDLAGDILNRAPQLVQYHPQNPGVIHQIAAGQVGDGRIVPAAWEANLDGLVANLQRTGRWDTITPEGLQQMIDTGDHGHIVVLGFEDHLARVISRFSANDWSYVYDSIREVAPTALSGIQESVADLTRIEAFFGLSVVGNSGWILAIITALSMFVSSWIMQQKQAGMDAGDDRARMMQKVTLFAMPLMMGFFTVGLAAATGIFWITSQLFQIVTDVILLKKAGTPINIPFIKPKPKPEVVDTVPGKKKK